MKRLLLFLFTLFSIQAFGQSPNPRLEMLIFPKYIQGGTATVRNIPYVYRAKIKGLIPGKTYRYQNRIHSAIIGGSPNYLYILPPANVIPGTPNYTPGDFYRPALTSANDRNGSASDLSSDYGLLTAGPDSTYTGWFIQETVRGRASGSTLFIRIMLNNPDASNPSAIAYMLYSDQPLSVLAMTTAGANVPGEAPVYGSPIRSTPSASAIPKNFVFLYDNEEGTGRPIAGTLIENDGASSTLPTSATAAFGYAKFYFNNVEGVNGAWGSMILNSDPNGIRRIEQRDFSDASIVGYNTSKDGTWDNGANPGTTVSTANAMLASDFAGLSAIVLDGSKVTLEPLKAPQTLTFTNTFPADLKFGDPDFTLAVNSTAGLNNFSYTVAPEGILQITGNTVKIIGSGTAEITVTEPGNAVTAVGTATKSITVIGIPQIISGLPSSLSAVYGDAAIELKATGGAGGNAVVYTSDNAAIAEILDGNKILIKSAGTVIIKANQEGKGGYSPAEEVSSTLTIAKASLDVIAEDKVKVRGEINPEATFVYGAFKNEDNASSVTGTPKLTIDAETTSAAGNYDINIDVSGLTSDKYTFNPVKGRLSIENKIAQVITFNGFPTSAVYGTSPLAFQISSNSTNVITLSSSNPGVAVAEKNALGEWTVRVTGAGEATITAAQASDANYIPGTATQHINIAKAPLTVIAEDKAKLSAAADPLFTVRYEGFVNGDGPDKLSGTLQFSKQVDGTAYQIIPTGLTAANYTLTFVNGKLTEGNTAFASMHKIYGDAPFNPGASGTAGTPTYTVANTAVAIVNTTGLIEIKGAGTTEITATFTGGESAIATLQVAQKEVLISPDAKTKIYAQANPELTLSYTGLAYGETESVFTAKPSLSTLATPTSAAGKYAITATGAMANNYKFNYEQGVLTITKAQLAFTYNDLPALTYGDASFIPVTTAEFNAQPIFSSDNANVAIIENGSVKIKGAGTANITVSFPGTDNYTGGTAVKTLVVAKRMLTVRTDSKTRLYGSANPTFTGIYEGFVNGETITAISAPAVYSTTATPLSPVGKYNITAASASAENYSFTYELGILSIEKSVLTVTADNKTRVYGTENPAFTFKYTGFVNADDASMLENGAIATTTALLTSPTGPYAIVPTGASDENYTFNYVNGILTVTSTSRTITFDPLAVKFVGDADFTPDAVLSSGENAVFTSLDETIATIVDNKIHIVGLGTVLITASAPVNANYANKPSYSQYLIVKKTPQTITFESVPVLSMNGKTYTLKATSTSGLPVSFSVSDPSSLLLNGNEIKGLRIGKIQITAKQAGNNQYAAAASTVNDVQIIDAAGDKVKVFPALSLNGDGQNEFLSIDGIKDFPNNKVIIMNRNGLKVFEIEGYDNNQKVFLGKTKAGVFLPQGTYFCLIEYSAEDSSIKRKTGYFILKY